MARMFKKAYVVIRDDLDQAACTNPNNRWDAERGQCIDFLTWDGSEGGKLGGANDLNHLWTEWNMDALATYRNAIDCWEKSGGKVGTVVPNQDWSSSALPQCFFGMEVVKGTFTHWHGTEAITLAGDFAGQNGLAGKLWPKVKCLQGLTFERDEHKCEYTWNGE